MKKVEVHGRRRLLEEGRIEDAKTLIALMWLRTRQGGEGRGKSLLQP